MNAFTLRHNAWYDEETVTYEVPGAWQVRENRPPTQPEVGADDLVERLRAPTGSPPLAELARGRRSAVLITDDLSRPTPSCAMIPPLVAELERGGIPRERIMVYIGNACHPPMTRPEMLKKLGPEVVGHLDVTSHNAFDDLVDLGTGPNGTPYWMSKHVLERDLKITVGGAYPHGGAGFGGAAKMIMPGVAGHRSTAFHHLKLRGAGFHGGTLDNPWREDSEEAAARVGLDFVVICVVDCDCRPIGWFAGDRVVAHREAVAFQKTALAADPPGDADVVIANSYPMDNALQYAVKGAWPLSLAMPDASRVLVATSPEGTGYHYIYPKLPTPTSPMPPPARETTLLYSPYLGLVESRKVYPDAPLYSDWASLRAELVRRHGRGPAKVAVYPAACLQVPTHLD